MNSRRLLVIAEVLLLILGFISLGWAGFVTARRIGGQQLAGLQV